MSSDHEAHLAAVDWRARANALQPLCNAVIDGALVPALSGARFDCISPIDGRRLASVAACDAADVGRAVIAARAAFERRVWADQAPAQRRRVLLKFAELI